MSISGFDAQTVVVTSIALNMLLFVHTLSGGNGTCGGGTLATTTYSATKCKVEEERSAGLVEAWVVDDRVL